MRSNDHDERAIDESIEETFPASDSITPSQPGSLLGSRHTARAAVIHSRAIGIGVGIGVVALAGALALLIRRQ